MIKHFIAILTLVSTVASAQVMYRCGNTFSQQPCGVDAKEIAMPKSKPGGCEPAGSMQCLNALEAEIHKALALSDKALNTKVVDNPPPDSVIAANKASCEAAARANLKDPESARVRDVRRSGAQMITKEGKLFQVVAYHLNINAKNSFGGYTGETLWRCDFDASESTLLSFNKGR